MQITLTHHQAAAVAEKAARWRRHARERRDRAAPTVRVVVSIENPYTTPETHGLYVAIEGHIGTRSPLFAKDLGQDRTFSLDRLPPRQEGGALFHPDMDGLGDDEFDMTPQLRALGWESRAVTMDGDPNVDEAASERYYNGDYADFSFWTPRAPDGDGWLLAAIYDKEDGPAALFVRKVD